MSTFRDKKTQSPGTGPFFGSTTQNVPQDVDRKHGPVPFALDGRTAWPIWADFSSPPRHATANSGISNSMPVSAAVERQQGRRLVPSPPHGFQSEPRSVGEARNAAMVRCANRSRTSISVLPGSTSCATRHFLSGSLHAPYILWFARRGVLGLQPRQLGLDLWPQFRGLLLH